MPIDQRRAVFFDRDGTLMEDTHYCADTVLVKVFPGVPDALRRLQEAGFGVFVITNQSGIGRGLITDAQYIPLALEAARISLSHPSQFGRHQPIRNRRRSPCLTWEELA